MACREQDGVDGEDMGGRRWEFEVGSEVAKEVSRFVSASIYLPEHWAFRVQPSNLRLTQAGRMKLTLSLLSLASRVNSTPMPPSRAETIFDTRSSRLRRRWLLQEHS